MLSIRQNMTDRKALQSGRRSRPCCCWACGLDRKAGPLVCVVWLEQRGRPGSMLREHPEDHRRSRGTAGRAALTPFPGVGDVESPLPDRRNPPGDPADQGPSMERRGPAQQVPDRRAKGRLASSPVSAKLARSAYRPVQQTARRYVAIKIVAGCARRTGARAIFCL